MSVFLPAILPVAVIILIGFIAGRILPLEIQTLSQLTVYVLAPALTAYNLYQTDVSIQSATGLLLGFTITCILLYSLARVVTKILKLEASLRKSLVATTLFPNTGNLGLPVITFALGSAGLERAIIYLIGTSILMFIIGPAMLRGGNLAASLRMTVKLPLCWAMVLGLGLRILSIELPYNIDKSMELVGEASIPVALIILGIQLARNRIVVGIYELLATALRLIAAPVVAYLVGQALHLEGLNLQVLILQSSMPIAINTLILVTEFGGDSALVARSIVLSTLTSFVTLPFILWATSNL